MKTIPGHQAAIDRISPLILKRVTGRVVVNVQSLDADHICLYMVGTILRPQGPQPKIVTPGPPAPQARADQIITTRKFSLPEIMKPKERKLQSVIDVAIRFMAEELGKKAFFKAPEPEPVVVGDNGGKGMQA